MRTKSVHEALRTNVLTHMVDDAMISLPPAAWAFFIAMVDAYGRSGGEIEVFGGDLGEGRSSMRIRPANVHGHMEFLFDADGRIEDVLWDSTTGPPPRQGDKKG